MLEVIRQGYTEVIQDNLFAQDLLDRDELPEDWKLDDYILSLDNKLYIPPILRLKVLKIYYNAPLASYYGR